MKIIVGLFNSGRIFNWFSISDWSAFRAFWLGRSAIIVRSILNPFSEDTSIELKKITLGISTMFRADDIDRISARFSKYQTLIGRFSINRSRAPSRKSILKTNRSTHQGQFQSWSSKSWSTNRSTDTLETARSLVVDHHWLDSQLYSRIRSWFWSSICWRKGWTRYWIYCRIS